MFDYNFFIKEIILIPTMIVVIMTLTVFMRNSLTKQSIEKLNKNLKGIKGYAIGSMLGAITPFCSCSSVPVFMGISKMGVSEGSAFSFLITSPLVHEVALIMIWQLFGWKLAVFYLTFSLLLGIIGGALIDGFKMSKHLIRYDRNIDLAQGFVEDKKLRFKQAFKESLGYVKKVLPIIIIGILIGSFIHDRDLGPITQFLESTNSIWHVLLAVIIGIPLYSGVAVGIPIAFGLISAGMGLGTGIAFILSVAGLSLPEMMMLKSVMKWKLLAFFVGYIAIGMVSAGVVLNVFESFF